MSTSFHRVLESNKTFTPARTWLLWVVHHNDNSVSTVSTPTSWLRLCPRHKGPRLISCSSTNVFCLPNTVLELRTQRIRNSPSSRKSQPSEGDKKYKNVISIQLHKCCGHTHTVCIGGKRKSIQHKTTKAGCEKGAEKRRTPPPLW